MSRTIWQTLGIDTTDDRAAIRRAYARLLKLTNPEDDAEGFQALRWAYERALAYADRAKETIFSENQPAAAEPVGTNEPEQPPPSEPTGAPPDRLAQHISICSHLEALVTGGSRVEPAVLIEALAAVWSSPAFEDIGVQAQTEQWLAKLIAAHMPRTDPLLMSAIEQFNWSTDSIRRSDANLIRLLVNRRRDLNFLSAIRTQGDQHHAAYKTLSQPPRRQTVWRNLRSPGRPQAIRALLLFIRTHFPSAINDLDARTVAEWDRYFSRPRISPWSIWAFLLTPPALIALPLVSRLVTDGLAIVELPLMLTPAFAVGSVIYVYAIAWPRKIWRMRWGTPRPPWLFLGWAPSAIILLIVATALPANRPIAVVIAALAVIIVYWATIGGDPKHPGRLHWVFEALTAQIYLTIWWWAIIAGDFPVAVSPQMTIALAACVVASSIGNWSLFGLWIVRFSPRGVLNSLLSLGALGVGAGLLLWLAWHQPDARPWAAIAVAVTVLIHKVPTMALGIRALRFRLFVMGLGGLGILFGNAAYMANGRGGDPVVLGGAWLLVGVGITVVVVSATAIKVLRQARARKDSPG